MHMQETASNHSEVCCRVLCIDADSGHHAMLQSVLVNYPGIELRIAIDGNSGIQAVGAAMPDLIVLNMSLPDMGGMDVVRALQPDMAEGSCQVVALTSEAFSIDIVKALSLGVREYWLKPLRPDVLKSDMGRLLNTATTTPERPTHQPGWLNPQPAARSA